MTIRFDDSLPKLASIVAETLGEKGLNSGVALRDSSGRLAFLSEIPLDASIKSKLAEQLSNGLGAYARKDRVVADSNDFGVEQVLADPTSLSVIAGDKVVRIVDRRLAGADWLRSPATAAPPPPRFVFVSLKGGVGRSTALAVAAAHLASSGRRVLTVDMDMEAPGLGAMLLDAGTVPEFGLIDALVENDLSGLDDEFLADLVGPSSLADRRGRIDVIPAFGQRSLNHPGDVLAKIARAYVEDVRPDGTVATLLDQVRSIVDRFSDPSRYDAILVDARAGLHETTAAAILGLGGEVFLFGLDEAQTFQGYSALFAHMARFSEQGATTPQWLDRITMVQGKAPRDIEGRASFVEKYHALVEQHAFQRAPTIQNIPVSLPGGTSFRDVPWDDDVRDQDVFDSSDFLERDPLAILDDNQFRLFDPIRNRTLLTEEIYRASYGVFLDRLIEAFPERTEGQS